MRVCDLERNAALHEELGNGHTAVCDGNWAVAVVQLDATIDAQRVMDGGVEVGYRDGAFNNRLGLIIGNADRAAMLQTASNQD